MMTESDWLKLQGIENSGAHRMTIRRETGGLRHYVDGQPVHAGDGIEIMLGDGTWLRGSYEWSFRVDAMPTFHFSVFVYGTRVNAEWGDDGSVSSRIEIQPSRHHVRITPYEGLYPKPVRRIGQPAPAAPGRVRP